MSRLFTPPCPCACCSLGLKCPCPISARHTPVHPSRSSRGLPSLGGKREKWCQALCQASVASALEFTQRQSRQGCGGAARGLLPFTNEETEAPRCEGPCPRSHSCQTAKPGLELGQQLTPAALLGEGLSRCPAPLSHGQAWCQSSPCRVWAVCICPPHPGMGAP